MTRTRIISIYVNKITGDVFDSIIELFPKLISNPQLDFDDWWPFIVSYDKFKIKFNQNKFLGIFNHGYLDEEYSWNTSMHIISNGNFSEVKIILKKPEQLTNFQFNQRVEKINEIVTSMKKILES